MVAVSLHKKNNQHTDVANDKKTIKVKEIAQLKRTVKDPKKFARLKNEAAFTLEISKRIGANMVDTVDQVKNKLAESIVVLAVIQGDKISLVSGLTKGIPEVIHAGDLMQFVANQLDGKGGGRRDMAQGGGTKIIALPEALSSVFVWVKETLID